MDLPFAARHRHRRAFVSARQKHARNGLEHHAGAGWGEVRDDRPLRGVPRGRQRSLSPSTDRRRPLSRSALHRRQVERRASPSPGRPSQARDDKTEALVSKLKQPFKPQPSVTDNVAAHISSVGAMKLGARFSRNDPTAARRDSTARQNSQSARDAASKNRTPSDLRTGIPALANTRMLYPRRSSRASNCWTKRRKSRPLDRDFQKKWWALRDSNPRPSLCKSDALTN
jgi:hypothetical protein